MATMERSSSTAAKPRLLFLYSARDGRARRVEGYLAQVLQRRRNHETARGTWSDGRARLVVPDAHEEHVGHARVVSHDVAGISSTPPSGLRPPRASRPRRG
jgi:hypothetical protein